MEVPMAIELSGLAARLKAGIDKAVADKEAEAKRVAEEAARMETARTETLEAQCEMLEALKAFADSVGHFEATTGKLWVEMVLGGAGLRFTAHRDDDAPTDHILVEAADGTDTAVAAGHHLTRDEVGEWEVVLQEEAGPRRLPVELGLEELFQGALALRSTGEPPNAAPAATLPDPPPQPERTTRRSKQPVAPPGSGLRPIKGPFG